MSGRSVSPSAPPEARVARVVVGPPADEDDATSWLTTFADMALQLFAFVLLMAVLGGRAAAVPAVQSPVVAAPAEAGDTAGSRPARPRGSSAGPRRFAASTSSPRDHAGRSDADVEVSAEPPPLVEQPLAERAARPGAALVIAGGDTEPPPAPAAPAVVVVAAQAAPPSDDAAIESAGSGGAGGEVDAAERRGPAERSAPPRPAAPALADDVDGAAARLRAAIGDRKGVRVAAVGGGIVVAIGEAIGFPTGRAELLGTAMPVLDQVRALARSLPEMAVEVSGHTDDRPIRTTLFPSNLELSLARAARVARALADGDPDLTRRVSAVGYGAERPVASNADDAGRARNRRVEVRLVPNDG